MNETSFASLSNFFELFPMEEIQATELETCLQEQNGTKISILFLWGKQCINCDRAKRSLLLNPEHYMWPDVKWFHCNVYNDPEMTTRFGLHGIPVFIVFTHTLSPDGQPVVKSVGRITSWPGEEAFLHAIEAQRQRHA